MDVNKRTRELTYLSVTIKTDVVPNISTLNKNG